MAKIDPNEEELLILPDDDSSDISFDTVDKKDSTEVTDTNDDLLITFDDDDWHNDVGATANWKSDESLEDTTSLDLDKKLDTKTAKLDSIEDSLDNLNLDIQPESIEVNSDKKDEELISFDVNTPVTTNTDKTNPPKEELINFDLEDSKKQETNTNLESSGLSTPTSEEVNMSELLWDNSEADKSETDTEIKNNKETLVHSQVEDNHASSELIEDNLSDIGDMSEILVRTIQEFEKRGEDIDSEIQQRTSHIQELEEELTTEKDAKAHLVAEHKAIEENRKTLEKMKADYEKKAAEDETKEKSAKK